MSVVGAFLTIAVLMTSVRVVRSSQASRAREALGQTFARVHVRQTEFRALNGRFATWPELRERGMALEARQSVKDWNADASHWFISIRDLDTGVICDRTGELFDEASSERPAVCRNTR